MILGRFREAGDVCKAWREEDPDAWESEDFSKLSSAVESLLAKEDRLIEALRDKGRADPAVQAILREISREIRFLPPQAGAVQAFWEDHRREVAAVLDSATVRSIIILKDSGDPPRPVEEQGALIRNIRKKLLAGADFDELARNHSQDEAIGGGGFNGRMTREFLGKKLSDAVFSLRPGEVSEVIESKAAYLLVKVEERWPGKADDFKDPVVRKAVEKLQFAERRKEWEEKYLAELQQRVGEEEPQEESEHHQS